MQQVDGTTRELGNMQRVSIGHWKRQSRELGSKNNIRRYAALAACVAGGYDSV